MNVMSLAVLVILALLGQCFGRPEIDPDNNGMTSTEDTGLSFEGKNTISDDVSYTTFLLYRISNQ